MDNKNGKEEYIKWLLRERPDIQLISEYVNTNTKIDHICKCGEVWNVRPSVIKRMAYCRKCMGEDFKKRNKSSVESYYDKLKEIGKSYIVVGEWKGTSYKTQHKCEKGHIFDAVPRELLNGDMPCCRVCSGSVRTTNEYKQWLNENIPEIKLIGEYNGNDKKILHECKCGNEWNATPASVKAGHYCSKCKSESIRNFHILSSSDYDLWLSKNKPEIKRLEEYTGNHVNIKHKCLKCGEIWSARPSNIKTGFGCPACSVGKIPREFRGWLHSIYKGEIRSNVRDVLENLEIDFYLPKEKIGFEFNDIRTHYTKFNEQTAKPSWNKGKTQSYHINKWKNAQKHGVRLIQVWDIEWQDKRIRPILQSVIKHALGISNHKIAARKCELKKVKPYDANMFFRENHIQSEAKGEGYFGLYYENELVGAICYAKTKKISENSKRTSPYTISRMAFKKDTSVIGGASRLLSAVRKEIEFKQIEYLVLNDYFNGASFEKTGWKKVREIPMPRYYDIEKKHSYYRHPSLYLERKQMCIDGKMLRYYTSGTTAYIL